MTTTEITKQDTDEAEEGFKLGAENGRVLYESMVEQVDAADMTDSKKTGFMMGFLEFFYQAKDNILSQAEAALAQETLN